MNRMILQWAENFGVAGVLPVDDSDYQVPFWFSGKPNNLALKIEPPLLTPAEEKLLRERAQRNKEASEEAYLEQGAIEVFNRGMIRFFNARSLKSVMAL
jgi:hypothetical protein